MLAYAGHVPTKETNRLFWQYPLAASRGVWEYNAPMPLSQSLYKLNSLSKQFNNCFGFQNPVLYYHILEKNKRNFYFGNQISVSNHQHSHKLCVVERNEALYFLINLQSWAYILCAYFSTFRRSIMPASSGLKKRWFLPTSPRWLTNYQAFCFTFIGLYC
jgi:hypothetical protein